MPTGYTAAVKDGVSFEEFAMTCARGMGACIMMRDEPLSTPVPDEFQPSSHHTDRLNIELAALELIKAMSDAECQAAAVSRHQSEVAEFADRQERDRATCERYTEMLDKVRAWVAPTPDHEGLKTFMADQLKQSIDFDGPSDYGKPDPEPMEGAEWRESELARISDQIAYHRKEHADELSRTRSRNEWVSALRVSLAQEATR